MNSRERVMKMFDGEPVDRLPCMPITMMFATDQLGRPYRDYATDYRVLAEAQALTAERFELDHVGTLSDPGREAADCGAVLEMEPDQPPAVVESQALLGDKARLATLAQPDPLGGGRMHDRVKAVAALKELVGQEKIIEGWVEGPCAEAADLRGINNLMLDFMDDPAFVNDLFAFNVEMGLAFARAQIEAGADVIGVGDAAASLVGPRIYEEFVLPHEKRLLEGIKELGGRIRMHICGNITSFLEPLATLPWDFLDVDYPVSMQDASKACGPDRVLAGNLDPVREIRDGTPESIRELLADRHACVGERFIVAAGCEITRDTSAENLMALTHYAQNAGS